MIRKLLWLSLLCGPLGLFLAAQQTTSTSTTPQDLTKTEDMTKFNVTLQEVRANVLVRDRNHNIINGLVGNQFRLYDNNKEQNLTAVDVIYTPISMVVAIQANAMADKILPQVTKIGAMLKPIVLGDQGEAAVIAYDARVRLMQPFTNDADDITKAVKNLHAGSTPGRTIDAVEQSIFLLSHRDKNRRRILLMIGEGRDDGSQARARETLQKAQLTNVAIYWIDMSHIVSKLTEAPPDPRPDNSLPASHPMPGGVPSTPTTMAQATGANGGSADAIPLMEEIFKDVKHIFQVAPATLFTKGTGGSQFSFVSQRGLENAISEISEQLHSQYLITYKPNNMEDGGFHQIKVDVIGHDYNCDTTPGYFMSSKF